jgi:hypothetical protein
MTAIRSSTLLLALLLGAFAADLIGCAKSGEQHLNESCQAKASKGVMDPACVVELSKREIAARLHNTAYAKYNVRFDPDDEIWVVMAYNENGPPDSHVYLSITPTGEVKDFRGAP